MSKQDQGGELRFWRGGTPYLPGINIAIRKRHWRVILVHNFATQPTDDGRINVMTEWNFFCQLAKPRITDGTIAVFHVVVITCR